MEAVADALDMETALGTLINLSGKMRMLSHRVAMFGILESSLFRALPYPEPDRLVWVEAVTDTGDPNSLSAEDYYDYRGSGDAFASCTDRSMSSSTSKYP